MRNPKTRQFVFLSVLIVLGLAQFGCLAVTRLFQPSSEPNVVYVTATPQYIFVTATPGPTPKSNIENLSDEEIKNGIQTALNIYAQAYNENNPALLDQVVDQENKPFRRLVHSRFDEEKSSSDAGGFDYKFTVANIQRREMGYVIAHFETNWGADGNWPFRFIGTGWVLTEPTVEQVGQPVTTETEHFDFITYPWADDVNPYIMDMMETARENVQKKLGAAPEAKAVVEIVPIYGLDPFGPPNAIAWYQQGGAEDGSDLITIYSPNAFFYTLYDPEVGWDGAMLETLTHEYTHMAHARNFNNAGRLADWIQEGLAEYVADARYNVEWACYNYKRDVYIPILDESDAVAKQDLMHMTNLNQDTSLAYSYSHALVKFTVDEFDGLDGFWLLAKNIDDTGDFKKAVNLTFGISYEEFNRRWQKWLRRQC